VAADTPASALIGAVLGVNAATVTGRGGGIDDAAWMRKCAAIRDAMRRARPALGDPLRLLTVAGGADIAAITGFLLQAAIRRTPVLLDGVVPSAGALLAQRIAFPAPAWWRAGHLSPDPAHAKALERLTLTPLLDYGVSLDAGAGALLALPLVQAAADLLSDAHL
jgi:nicotinate-nucleotide--dimethylbenzimidazole phosphoribosyltransferase